MVAFTAIILLSFLVLCVVVSSIVRSYSAETTERELSRIALSVEYLIVNDYNESEISDFREYISENTEDTEKIISGITRYNTDMFVIVVDTQGNVIVTDESTPEAYVSKTYPSDFPDTVDSDGKLMVDTKLQGALDTVHYVYAIPIDDVGGSIQGYILACTPSSYTNFVVSSLMRMIIMASMWVMIASIIASYFISERTVRPVRMVSRAARSFAKGQFDVRVPVVGNDEVSELAISFNNMASSLATLEDTRTTFLANVSHDLRTPMTTISGYIQGILDGAIPPEKYEYYLNIIRNEVLRLSRLVSSLLDISRISAGERKFNMQPFDICEMARQVLLSFESQIDAKKLDVEFECDEEKQMVLADSDAIHQILYNICDNAVKFSREGGKYAIRIGERNKKIYVSVFNEGEGISPEDLPHIFDRFYKSDKSRGKDKTGVGLGMYIAKTIVDAHGETISVTSKYGENCEFVFTLQKCK